ncbi:NADH dehydrogenase (ubiquinone) subunit ND-13B [Lasioglossum baleicum]|uniref:NADH dehydrogenase (ubiquinone) subunit ND-13B n=1 Tax=Lasioglossum baleicum TaxID=434251 RepID=UPI003FCEA486
MAKLLKKTTGLTGLAVAENPRRDLTLLYTRIMKALAGLPSESAYKRHTEALIKERNSIVEQNEDVSTIEDKIGCGQVEELILQAQKELNLVEQMTNWKTWESLVEEAPRHQWTWPPHK